MHQWIPAAPSPPATMGHLPGLSVPGVRHLQILRCPGAGNLPTLGPPPSFWHARRFLLEYNYTEDFTGKTSRFAHLSRTGKIEEGIVKACCWFYAWGSSSLFKPELHDIEIGSYWRLINVFLFIKSNFCWYFCIRRTMYPFIFIKLFVTDNSALLILMSIIL